MTQRRDPTNSVVAHNPKTSPGSDVPRNRVFHSLDGLRGIAAISVVIYHFRSLFAPTASSGGYLAVDLFFIMSGVVIAHAYDERFRIGFTLKEFMRARFIRLYPLYFLGTLLGSISILASIIGHNKEGWDLLSFLLAAVSGLLFIPFPYGHPEGRMYPMNAACWSLLFEVLVNVAFGLLWRHLTTLRLFACCLVSGALLANTIAQHGSVDVGFVIGNFLPATVRTVFGFSTGVLIARHAHHFPGSASAAGFLLISSVVTAAVMGNPSAAQRVWWDTTCVLVAFPAVVYLATRWDPPGWLIPLTAFLGITSYALYVLHGPLSAALNASIRRLVHNDSTLGAPYSGISLIGILLLISWFVDRYLDVPVRKVLGRIVPFTGRG